MSAACLEVVTDAARSVRNLVGRVDGSAFQGPRSDDKPSKDAAETPLCGGFRGFHSLGTCVHASCADRLPWMT